jgi:uncharacterized protein (DUF2225 family)
MRSCPRCGRFFANIHCPACGFSGKEELFSIGCPSCGYSAPPNLFSKFKSRPKKENRLYRSGNLPLWVYILSVFALIITLAILVIILK